MARTTKSVSRTRSARQGASKKSAGKRAAARSTGAERGAVRRGAAKSGSAKGRRARAALEPKGWTVNFVSGETLQLEADSIDVDTSGTVRFSLLGTEMLFISPANYNFIMEASEPLEGTESGSD
jgi:hypothetical protein